MLGIRPEHLTVVGRRLSGHRSWWSSRPARKCRSSARTPGGEEIVANLPRTPSLSGQAKRYGWPPSPGSSIFFTARPGSAYAHAYQAEAQRCSKTDQEEDDHEVHQTRCDSHHRWRGRRRPREPVRRLAGLRPGRLEVQAGRRARSCACCAGRRSSRATRTRGSPTPRSSPKRPASRSASTRKAGRTSVRRRRSPPMSAPART